MRKDSWSIGFACALGAFVGALISLDLAARFEYGPYFAILGALFGGVIAYVMIDFRKFCQGAKRAWKKVVSWRPNWEYWKTFSINFLGFFLVCIEVFLVFGIILAYSALSHGTSEGEKAGALLALKFLVVVIFCFSAFLSSVCTVADQKNREYGMTYLKYNVVVVSYLFFKYLVTVVIPATPWVMEKTFWFLVSAVIATGIFPKFLFVYVHSARRTICFIDASIGAAIGYAVGSALAGAIAGVIIGVVNYEFVSVRWLKLIPARDN